MRTPAELAMDLAALGVRPGDTLMVHASLRAIGPVEGRAAGVVEALDLAVGEAGTLLMVLGARDDFAWVNERPENERAALLADAAPFDALRTPAQPDVGYLAEAFRTHPGTFVTYHPEGRFGARGARASELLENPPWHDYYGPGSPLERLCRLGGKVLRLGADLETVTLLHYAEYLAPLPEKRRVRRHRLIRRGESSAVVVVRCLDDEHGIVDYPAGDYFGLLLRSYLATKRALSGKVGDAPSELIDASDLVEFAVPWMAEHLVKRFPCPCCGYLTFTGPPGGYECCPICYWEDDAQQLRWPRLEAGSNTVSLEQAQKIYAECGVSQRRFESLVRKATADDVREPSFRPISQDDTFEDMWSTEPWPGDKTTLYWWRPTYWRKNG